MTALVLRNLLAYSGQIAVLIAAGGLLLWLLKLQAPIRLRCLQLLLGCCILLPLIQPWQLPRAVSAGEVSARTFALDTSAASAGRHWFPGLSDIVIGIIAAGMVIRLALVLLGLCRLSRYRKTATFQPKAFAREKERVGAWPDVYVSEEVNGPVTFGLLHPAILVPSRWINDERVALHELMHVHRRDWSFTLFEEIFRALLWFHPAVWWLTGGIQLAREETVDRAVLEFTHSREQYLATLLAMAEARADIGLAHAPLFLKKRHLRQRIAALIQEVSMSKFRIRSSLAGFGALVAITGWMGMRSLPLQAAPQSVTDAPGVTVQVDEAKILHRSPVEYPRNALANGVQGTVIIDATLDKKGEVTEAKVASGPQELRAAALESVLQWHFNPDAQTSPAEIAIHFAPPSQRAVRIGSAVAEANLIRKVQPDYPPLAKAARVQGSVEFRVTIGKDGHVENIELMRGHPLLVNAAKDALMQWVYRPTLLNGAPVDVQTEVVVRFTLPPDQG
jgi:TonB family protein